MNVFLLWWSVSATHFIWLSSKTKKQTNTNWKVFAKKNKTKKNLALKQKGTNLFTYFLHTNHICVFHADNHWRDWMCIVHWLSNCSSVFVIFAFIRWYSCVSHDCFELCVHYICWKTLLVAYSRAKTYSLRTAVFLMYCTQIQLTSDIGQLSVCTM